MSALAELNAWVAARRGWAGSTRPGTIRTLTLHGHGLRNEGKPVDGLERGACWCGASSPPLESNAARKRWHKQHVVMVLTSGDSGLVTDMDRRLSE